MKPLAKRISIFVWTLLVIPNGVHAEGAPDWFHKEQTCPDCIYQDCSSLPLESEQEAVNNSTLSCYKQLATEQFGMGIDLISRQDQNNQGSQIQEKSQISSRIQNLPSEVVKRKVMLAAGKYTVYLRLRFKSADLVKEKEQAKKYANALFSKNLEAITQSARIGHPGDLTGALLLKGVVGGSRVLLDDSDVANGEAYFPKVGIGRYKLSILRDGFHPLSTEFSIDPSKRTVLRIEQAPFEGEVLLDTSPPNSYVQVDDKPKGLTPFRERLKTGRYKVRIEKEGFNNREFYILVETDKKIQYEVTLQPKGLAKNENERNLIGGR